jgi:hypothetical protein
MRPDPLMLDRLGKVLHIGDIVLVLGIFPATIKDFKLQDGELCAIVRRPSRQDSFVYFEEIERLDPARQHQIDLVFVIRERGATNETIQSGFSAPNGAQEKADEKKTSYSQTRRAS